jgi:hypothetical protein
VVIRSDISTGRILTATTDPQPRSNRARCNLALRKCSGNGNTGLTVGALGGAIATVVLRGDVETLIAAEPVFERVRAGWTGRRVGLAGLCSRIARLIARALNPTVTTVIIGRNIDAQRATGLELSQVHAVCTNRRLVAAGLLNRVADLISGAASLSAYQVGARALWSSTRRLILASLRPLITSLISRTTILRSTKRRLRVASTRSDALTLLAETLAIAADTGSFRVWAAQGLGGITGRDVVALGAVAVLAWEAAGLCFP